MKRYIFISIFLSSSLAFAVEKPEASDVIEHLEKSYTAAKQSQENSSTIDLYDVIKRQTQDIKLEGQELVSEPPEDHQQQPINSFDSKRMRELEEAARRDFYDQTRNPFYKRQAEIAEQEQLHRNRLNTSVSFPFIKKDKE